MFGQYGRSLRPCISWPITPRRRATSRQALLATLDHVLWIGGGPGAGKTTAARLLAHRNDLRLYPVDARAHAHAARSRGPTMLWLNSLSPEERFARPPDVLADEFLDYAREQFELVLEDLRAFAGSPPIVAEGPQLLPELTGPQSVFVVPTEEFRRTGLFRRQPGRRPQIVARDSLLTRTIREQARELGRTVIDVDGSLVPDELVAELEVLFASTLDVPRGPVDLAAMRHEENAVITENLVAAGVPSYSYACECGLSGCTERVELTPAAFASSRPVLSPVHAR